MKSVSFRCFSESQLHVSLGKDPKENQYAFKYIFFFHFKLMEWDLQVQQLHFGLSAFGCFDLNCAHIQAVRQLNSENPAEITINSKNQFLKLHFRF